MNCPKCAGANFGWARKCDHCGFVFADESASQALARREQRRIRVSNLPSNPDDLQFDYMVLEVPASSSLEDRGTAGVGCSRCHASIPDVYYEVNGNIVCQRCRLATEAAVATPKGAVPFMTAALFGFGASILGALIYFAVIYFFHLSIGIVAILIGYMVGYTVRKGARGRGGLRFQVLAAALTYGSVALAYFPVVVISSIHAAQSAHRSASAAPSVATTAQRPRETQRRGPVAGIAVLVVFVAELPILLVLGSFPGGLIRALIFLIGMRQAWSMTAAATLTVFGPYRVGAVPQSEPL